MTGIAAESLWTDVEALGRQFADLPLAKGYFFAAILWTSFLLPAHFISRLWSTSYRKQAGSFNRIEWLSRCVSNLHAVLVSIILTYAVFGETSAYEGGEYELRWLNRCGLILAVGYFCYDGCLLLSSFDSSLSAGPAMLLHHILVASIIHYTLTFECPMVIIWSAGVYLTEYSTPFVNARWFLLFRHKEEVVYKVFGTLMAIAFFFARILYMPLFLAFLFQSDGLISTIPSKTMAFRFGIIGMFGHFVLYSLNVYWFSLIMRGIIKMVQGLITGKNIPVDPDTVVNTEPAAEVKKTE